MNKSPLTPFQGNALKRIDDLCNRLDDPRRWVTQEELPGVRLDPLVDKKYLRRKKVLGVLYYQTTKQRSGKPGNVKYTDIIDTNAIVLEVDDIVVTIGHPATVSEYDAVCIAKEMVEEEHGEQMCPESCSTN